MCAEFSILKTGGALVVLGNVSLARLVPSSELLRGSIIDEYFPLPLLYVIEHPQRYLEACCGKILPTIAVNILSEWLHALRSTELCFWLA